MFYIVRSDDIKTGNALDPMNSRAADEWSEKESGYMPCYEHVFIARPDVSSQHVESLVETFSNVLTEGGGNVGKTEYWGLRNLAYRIRKNRKGHYVLMNIDAPHPAVAEMERQMRLHDDIMRFMTLRVDTLDDAPSIMMQAREERGRGRRERRGPREGNSDYRSSDNDRNEEPKE